MGPVDESPLAFRAQCFGGDWPSGRGAGCVGLRKKLGVEGFLLVIGCCAGGGVYGESMSGPFLIKIIEWALPHLIEV